MRPRRRPRIVVDTNVFISGILSHHGFPHQLLLALYAGDCMLLISFPLLDELLNVLTRGRIAGRYAAYPEVTTRLVSFLHRDAQWISPLDEVELPVHCRDAKDDRFLACALAGACDYLVTGDQDLLVLNGDPLLGKLAILTPRQVIEALSLHP